MLIGFCDTETTGKLDPAHRIIEVCVQRWNVENLGTPAMMTTHLLDTVTQRIDPERSIDPAAQKVHNISLDDLRGKPNFTSVAPSLRKLVGSCDLIVAHNGDEFDKPFLEMEFERVKVPKPDRPWFDTMNKGRWATPTGKPPTLRDLAWSCDVEYDPEKAHAAEYDVTVLAKCFFFGVRTGFFVLS